MRLLLFLKKNDNEGIESYFLGDLTVDKETLEEIFDKGKKKKYVKMKMYLDKPIKNELYKYIKD